MEWLIENFMFILVLGCLIFMFTKFIYNIVRTMQKANEVEKTDKIPECTPILAKYFLDNEKLNSNAIKSTFLDLCKKEFIVLNPIISKDDNISDFELINNGIPKFKEDEYEKNLFNTDFLESNINLSYLYVFNNYIFKNNNKILFSKLISTIDKIDVNEDEELKRILSAELYNRELIVYKEENKNGYVENTEKGKELLNNIKGLKLFLKKYNLIDGFETEDIKVWGDYFIFGLMYGLEKFSIDTMKELYIRKYFET